MKEKEIEPFKAEIDTIRPEYHACKLRIDPNCQLRNNMI